MNNYLNEEAIRLVEKAYIHEIRNMMIYTEISSYLAVLGYKSLSAYYQKWADEERQHSLWVKEFMDSINLPIQNSPFENISFTVDRTTLTSFAKQTLDVENETTKLYDEILEIAHEFESSAILIQFANKFLIEQIEEISKANDIYDSISNIGDNRAMLQLFDNTFEG